MKTRGEIEAPICQGTSRFELESIGRRPKDILTHLIDDLVVVRLQDLLTSTEQPLVKSVPAEKGRDLIKQVRTHLLETAWPLMEAMVQKLTAIEVLRLNPYISTVTRKEVVFVAVIQSPHFREVKKKPKSSILSLPPYRSCSRTSVDRRLSSAGVERYPWSTTSLPLCS